ncbi:hypothetical protein GYA27_02590 [candidate division WWE3 bacterium]|uniref:Uncharacterized protein n=1 Tax=candidate division WWE3 bacterium TaxID=2053526 RepID=A0A7X9DKG2_UNCKA|nr:hypothetical protein [candidate division WWE3 bacterium]
MAASYEALPHSTLTDNFSRLAESGKARFTPISPERYIKPPEVTYNINDLERLTTEELEKIGISVDEVLEKLVLEETTLSKPEKNSGYETAMEWVNGYWDAMNKSLEKRLVGSNSKSEVYYADVRLRALGVKRFLSVMQEFTDEGTFNQVNDILVTACDICVLAEANAGKLNMDNIIKSGAIGRAVNLGLSDPKALDMAMKLVSAAHTERLGLFDHVESLVDGIKAEIVAGRIVSGYDFPDVGYDMVFQKPPAFRDVNEGADFVLTIHDGKFSKELALFDVKKAEISNGQGSCRVVTEGNLPKIYEGDYERPSNLDLYDIEANFLYAVAKNNEMGIVIRLPRDLVTNYSVEQLSEMDNKDNPDYNEAKSHIYRELGYILERVGK